MALTQKLLVAALATTLMAGCTAMKRATGQIDSTTLPGQREDILPPDQQQARDPAITGQPLPGAPNAALPQQPQGGISNTAVGAPGAGKPMAPGSKGQESIVDNGGKTGADCDPKVDLCPPALKQEPLPPPSPLLPDKPAKDAKAKAKDAKAMAMKKMVKKPLKKKKPAQDPVPPEPKMDAPPAPGPADQAPPVPQAQ